MKISVVTPLYRSERYVEELYNRSISALNAAGASDYEIIFVNDSSPDDCLEIASAIARRDANVMVIDLSRNFGQYAASLEGISRSTGDYVYILDSDLEEEPEWIGLFLAKILDNNCDVAYGVNNNRKKGILYSKFRQIFYKILNTLSPSQFPENTCTARLMSCRYVEALLEFEERELFMAGIWHMVGFKQCPVEVIKHDTSPTTYSPSKLISIFVNAVTAFSTRPLTIISVAGTGLSVFAFLFLVVILVRRLLYGTTVEGWASVMGVVLLVGGVNLFFTGVIAIYIAKIFIEVKRRPRAIIKEIRRH